MDDAQYKMVIAKVESFAMELRDHFPVLNSAVGTLSINISFPGITVSVNDAYSLLIIRTLSS